MTTERAPDEAPKSTANGGHNQIWLKQKPSVPPDHGLSDEQKALRSRLILGGLLIVLAFALVPFVPARIVDPGHKWITLDPLFGLLLYWPLSRVMIRSTSSLLWGNLLALIPSIVLVSVRFFGSQRDPHFGTQPNLSFGTMIFLGVCSLAAYLLFRTPPKH